mgnify:CR=1 FL=1
MNTEIRLSSNPKSRFSEAIKTIRTNLAFSSIDKELKVILITSPEAGDGKSYISANLAVAYAQEGKKVLLVAGDTFRAGATKQLEEWATRVGVDFTGAYEGADPASVIFDGITKAKEKID